MVGAVFAVYIIYDLAPAADAEVDVDIRHGDALRVQKALEIEAVLDGVDVRYAEAVGDDAAGGGAAPGADGYALALGVADEVRDYEEVVHKAHLAYHVELIAELAPGVLAPGAVAALEARLAELFEVSGAVRLALGQLEARQVIAAELEVEAALGGDLGGVVRGGLLAGEERAHLLLALEVELLGVKAHALRVVHGLAGLDAHEDVLVIGVLAVYIVRVVGDGEGDAGLLVDADDAAGGGVLVGYAVALYLEVEVLAEGVPQLQRAALGLVIAAGDYLLRDVARKAAGEADQALRVLIEQRPVYARLDVEALYKAHGDEVAEVAVARLVLAEQNEVSVLGVHAVLAVRAPARGDIDLAADDGLDALLHAGLVKGHRAVHNAVVGYGKAVKAQLLCARHQLFYAAGPVEQAVFRMQMQMREGQGSIPLPYAPAELH